MNIDKQYASDNYWEGNDPRSIMLHTTGGESVIGAVDTLIARGLSYNYIIKYGKVYELVPYDKSAWHAGVIRQPNLRSKVFYNTLKDSDNPNRNSVGIAFASTSILKDEDIDVCVTLIKWLGSETGNRFNADNIFYHKEVTIDKPVVVREFRKQILDALVGDKDDKDSGEITRMKLFIQYLQLKIQLLILQKRTR